MGCARSRTWLQRPAHASDGPDACRTIPELAAGKESFRGAERFVVVAGNQHGPRLAVAPAVNGQTGTDSTFGRILFHGSTSDEHAGQDRDPFARS